MRTEYVSAPEPCSYPVSDEDCGAPARYFLEVTDGRQQDSWRIYRCREHAYRRLPNGWQVVTDGYVVVDPVVTHRDLGDESDREVRR